MYPCITCILLALAKRPADLGIIYRIFYIWKLYYFYFVSLLYKIHCLKLIFWHIYFVHHFHAHLYSSFNHQFYRSCTALYCLSQDNKLFLSGHLKTTVYSGNVISLAERLWCSRCLCVCLSVCLCVALFAILILLYTPQFWSDCSETSHTCWMLSLCKIIFRLILGQRRRSPKGQKRVFNININNFRIAF